jgi:endonuclease YncB( thermonuclease family)
VGGLLYLQHAYVCSDEAAVNTLTSTQVHLVEERTLARALARKLKSRVRKAHLFHVANVSDPIQKDVEVIGDKTDRYGRMVGKILYRGRDVNIELVRAGLAWWYRTYSNEQPPADRRSYEIAENEARAAGNGLWSEPSPTAPWDWRRKARE